MEDITTEDLDITEAIHEDTASPSPAATEHIRTYLDKHRRSIWAIIRSLNKEIKAMAKELLSQALDAEIRKVQLYRQFDTDIANKLAHLRRRPKLAKDAAFYQTTISSIERREAALAAWSTMKGADIELDPAGKERVQKVLDEKVVKKAAITRGKKARRQARKKAKAEEEAKKMMDLEETMLATTLISAKEDAVAPPEEETELERVLLKRKRVETDEDVMELEKDEVARPAKMTLVFRLRSGAI